MSTYRILIVEDDPMVALDLEAIVEAALESDVVVSATIEGARQAACLRLDFALLDVDVLDGKTYEFAIRLRDHGVPFAFVTASDKRHVPECLRDVPFVTKPFTARAIEALLARAAPEPD